MRSARQSDFPESPFLWTRGTAVRETLRYLDRKRIEAEPLLAKAELSRNQLSRDDSGISAASQYRFLELAATETDESLLGLRVAAEMDMREVGVLFYLAASSATVATALEHLVRYAATTSEEVRPEVSRLGNETVLTHRPMLAFDEPRRQFSEFISLALMRVLCKLTNRDLAPSRVTFAHARNTELREIHRILRCPVEFAHSVNSWAFPESIVQLPIVSADSHLLHILETHADDLLSKRRKTAGLRGMVENHLLSLLPSGKVQAAVVAQQLGMSLRSLTRQLAAEGVSFGEILDHLRNRLAVRYLEDQRISLQQIAWLLGYSELAAFNHAFKRWFGTSPSRARNRPASIPST
jgi:AraC-like DNA-binding protein